MRIERLWILAVFAVLVFSNLASASYIKADFSIDDTGKVVVSGDADKNPDIDGIEINGTRLSGTSTALTSKIKDIWDFNIALDYDDVDIRILLPADSNIFNIATENKFSIASDLNQIVLEVKDNKPIKLEFYYSTGLSEPRFNVSGLVILIFIFIIAANGAIIYYLYRKLQKKPKKIIKKEKVDRSEILYDTLNEKEKQIIESVKKGADYQAKIMKETNIPKASLSRYINNLIKKEFLIRKGEGKLSKIILKK